MPKNRLMTIEKQLTARDKHRQFLSSMHQDKTLQETEACLTALQVEHRTLKRLLPGNRSGWVPGVPPDPRFTVKINEEDKMCLTANLSCQATLNLREKEYARTGGFVYEPRYDGMLLRLTYNKRGVLSEAHTQGDGLNGQDVLHRVGMIEGLVKQLSGEQVSVTGVVVCLKDDYQHYCDHFSLDDTTPGHLVTYLMGKEGDIDKQDSENNEDTLPLYFIAFHASHAIRKRCKTYDKLTAWLQRQGFVTPECYNTCPGTDCQDSVYPVNGIILKQTDLAQWETPSHHIWYNWVVCIRDNTGISRRLLKDVFWYFDNGILQAKGLGVADSRVMQSTEAIRLRYPTLYRKGKLAKGDIVEIDDQRQEIIGYVSAGFGECIELPRRCHYCDTPLTVTGPHQLTCQNVGHCPAHPSVRYAKTFSPHGLNLWPKGKPTEESVGTIKCLQDVVALLNKPAPEGTEGQALRQRQKVLREQTRTGRMANWLYATGLHGLTISRCYIIEQALCETRHTLSAEFVVNWLSCAENLHSLFGIDSLTILSDVTSQRDDLLAFLACCPWPNEQQQLELACPVLIALSDEISAKHFTLTQRMQAMGWCVDSVITKKTTCFLTGIGGLSSHRLLAKRYGVPVIETVTLSIDDIIHYIEAKHVL